MSTVQNDCHYKGYGYTFSTAVKQKVGNAIVDVDANEFIAAKFEVRNIVTGDLIFEKTYPGGGITIKNNEFATLINPNDFTVTGQVKQIFTVTNSANEPLIPIFNHNVAVK